MAETTGIEWADSTANLWMGCTKLSPACDNCYAERDFDLRKHMVQWGPHGDRRYVKAGWALIRKMQKRAAANGGIDPDLGRKRRIFVNSLSDFFDNHKSIDPAWRGDAGRLFEESPDVIIMLVTKRPENIRKMVPLHWLEEGRWPAHVWVMITAEDQQRYDHRWPILRDLPVPVKALSIEPLLGPVRLRFMDEPPAWVIVGGESGPNARPMHPEWARTLRNQCAALGIQFHFKQWGEWSLAIDRERDDPDWRADYTNAFAHRGNSRWLNLEGGCGFHGENFVVMSRIGKKAAGRLLDGVEHNGVPA